MTNYTVNHGGWLNRKYLVITRLKCNFWKQLVLWEMARQLVWSKHCIFRILPIVLSLYLWGEQLSNQCVLIFTDNEALVHVINMQSCCDTSNVFVRKLVASRLKVEKLQARWRISQLILHSRNIICLKQDIVFQTNGNQQRYQPTCYLNNWQMQLHP